MIYFYNKHKRKLRYFFPILFIGGITFAAVGFNNPPLFDNADNFILFAQKEVKLEKEVQISSGDIGSNKKINIDKDSIINGNLFADKIELGNNTQINGNVSYNKLKTKKETQIYGTQTNTVSLPIANMPEVSDFPTGNQNLTFQGENNTLIAGDYKNITLKKDSRLILSGGVYNIKKLELKKNSTIIFSNPTTLNIKDKFTGKERISILPDNNLIPQDLTINFPKNKFIHFNKQSFLNFKLLAPKADVRLGNETTFRGQVIAKRIFVGKGTVLSRNITASLQPKQEDIIVTDEGAQFVVNQIVLQLTFDGTIDDANAITESIDGNIVGIVPSINLYQIVVQTETTEELDALIQQLLSQQNLLIKNVTKNVIISLIE